MTLPAVDPVTAHPGSNPGAKAAHGKIAGWVAAHKAVASAGVGVVGYAVYKRKQSGTSGASTVGADGTTATAASPDGYDSTGLDAYNALESQITGLANTVASTQASTTQTAAPTQPKAETNSALPPVDAAAYPVLGSPNEAWDVLGTISSVGGGFIGENVKGGAPVYANIGGKWQQDFNVGALPVGTQLAVPQGFAGYVVPGVTTEKL